MHLKLRHTTSQTIPKEKNRGITKTPLEPWFHGRMIVLRINESELFQGWFELVKMLQNLALLLNSLMSMMAWRFCRCCLLDLRREESEDRREARRWALLWLWRGREIFGGGRRRVAVVGSSEVCVVMRWKWRFWRWCAECLPAKVMKKVWWRGKAKQLFFFSVFFSWVCSRERDSWVGLWGCERY